MKGILPQKKTACLLVKKEEAKRPFLIKDRRELSKFIK